MKKDITTREDIETLVNLFYEAAKKDAVIGYFFTDVVALDFDKHLPVMYDFWESALLGTLTYKGNPMTVHINLDKKEPIQHGHFDRWLVLFVKTIELNFEGEKAQEAKAKATNIRHLMQYKVEQSRSK